MGNTAAIGGYSVGVGADVGFGASVGGALALGVTGNPFQGPIGSPTSFAVTRGLGGTGYGINAGIDMCKTEVNCLPCKP